MARPRSNKLHNKGKGTPFGKQSDAEKTFRKRPRTPRGEDFKRSSRPPGDSFRSERPRPGDFRKNEGGSGTTAGRGGKAPFRSGPGNFRSSDKPDFRGSGKKSYGARPDRDDSRSN